MEKSMRVAMLLPCLNFFKKKTGIDLQTLERLGLPVQQLSEPNARISVSEIDVLLKLIKQHLEMPELGLVAGETFELRNYGLLGFMLSYCTNVKELFDLSSRYYCYISSSKKPVLKHADGYVHMQHKLTAGEEAEARTRGELFVSAIYQFSRFLSNDRIRVQRIAFEFSEPEYTALYAEYFPGVEIVFDSDVTCMSFNEKDLTLELDFPDHVMKARLQADLDAIIGAEQNDSYARRIESLLVTEDQGFAFNLSMQEIASLMNVGVKTLSRRLADEGYRFSDLHEHVRSQCARRMLRETQLKIECIARELGFTDRSAFERAFRRWEASSPAQYRKQCQ